ncbi:hypothetical protein D3C77_657000 [compost metagenome]
MLVVHRIAILQGKVRQDLPLEAIGDGVPRVFTVEPLKPRLQRVHWPALAREVGDHRLERRPLTGDLVDALEGAR